MKLATPTTSFFRDYWLALAGLSLWAANLSYFILVADPDVTTQVILSLGGLAGTTLRPLYDGSIPVSEPGKLVKIVHLLLVGSAFVCGLLTLLDVIHNLS